MRGDYRIAPGPSQSKSARARPNTSPLLGRSPLGLGRTLRPRWGEVRSGSAEHFALAGAKSARARPNTSPLLGRSPLGLGRTLRPCWGAPRERRLKTAVSDGSARAAAGHPDPRARARSSAAGSSAACASAHRTSVRLDLRLGDQRIGEAGMEDVGPLDEAVQLRLVEELPRIVDPALIERPVRVDRNRIAEVLAVAVVAAHEGIAVVEEPRVRVDGSGLLVFVLRLYRRGHRQGFLAAASRLLALTIEHREHEAPVAVGAGDRRALRGDGLLEMLV